jgi:hypothetical protein
MQPAENSVGSTAKQRNNNKRGSAAPNDLRYVLKIAERGLVDFPFAQDWVTQITQAVFKAIESQRTRDAVHTEEHESTRADLGAMFNGKIEEAIRKLPVKDASGAVIEDHIKRKQRFGRRWRRNEQYYFTAEQLGDLKDAKQDLMPYGPVARLV